MIQEVRGHQNNTINSKVGDNMPVREDILKKFLQLTDPCIVPQVLQNEDEACEGLQTKPTNSTMGETQDRQHHQVTDFLT